MPVVPGIQNLEFFAGIVDDSTRFWVATQPRCIKNLGYMKWYLVPCWNELRPLSGRVDAIQWYDGVLLLSSIVCEDVDDPRTNEVNVDVVPGFGVGMVVSR